MTDILDRLTAAIEEADAGTDALCAEYFATAMESVRDLLDGSNGGYVAPQNRPARRRDASPDPHGPDRQCGDRRHCRGRRRDRQFLRAAGEGSARAEPADEAEILPGFKVVARTGSSAAISPFELRYDGRFVALANSPEDAFRQAREGSVNLRKVEAFNRAHAEARDRVEPR